MRIDGKHRITTGAYMDLTVNNDLTVNMTLDVKWYGWVPLYWKAAHKEYEFKWYQYPKLLWVIASHSLKKMFT